MTLSLSKAAMPVILGDASLRVGISSWSDRSLTHESSWYPKRSMRAAERMAYYAERFSVVEIETTYRFPPTPAVTQQWVDRTPTGFRFDIQAWSLLTGQPTMPASLWEDMREEIHPERRDNARLYETHLTDGALDEAWKRFTHAVLPLHASERLGTIVLRYPRWFVPRERNFDVLRNVRERLGDLPAAVELSCAEWVEPEYCEETFSLLEDLAFSFVCVDAGDDDPRGLRGAAATTNDLGVVRLLGRRQRDQDDAWSPDRRGYRYTRDELRELLPRLQHLAGSCNELHVLISTCWRDDAARNGELLTEVLGCEPTIRLP